MYSSFGAGLRRCVFCKIYCDLRRANCTVLSYSFRSLMLCLVLYNPEAEFLIPTETTTMRNLVNVLFQSRSILLLFHVFLSHLNLLWHNLGPLPLLLLRCINILFQPVYVEPYLFQSQLILHCFAKKYFDKMEKMKLSRSV